MKYLLDTNILSELIKKQSNPHLISRLASKPPQALFTSCICVMELRFGSALRKDFESFWLRIGDEILTRVTILPLSADRSALPLHDTGPPKMHPFCFSVGCVVGRYDPSPRPQPAPANRAAGSR